MMQPQSDAGEASLPSQKSRGKDVNAHGTLADAAFLGVIVGYTWWLVFG